MTGMSISTIVSIVYTISVEQNSEERQFLLSIYGGYSIPIFFLYMFSWCLIIFRKTHINWVLIFELDPRSNRLLTSISIADGI